MARPSLYIGILSQRLVCHLCLTAKGRRCSGSRERNVRALAEWKMGKLRLTGLGGNIGRMRRCVIISENVLSCVRLDSGLSWIHYESYMYIRKFEVGPAYVRAPWGRAYVHTTNLSRPRRGPGLTFLSQHQYQCVVALELGQMHHGQIRTY